jgi:signal transduction histidine kinase/DNA-binding response OmpR family regulator
LPFIFSVNLIMNNFHELWLYWEIFMVFVLMMFVPNWLIFFFDFIIGVLGAILFYLLSTPHITLNPTFNIPLYGIVLVFSIVAGYMFNSSNWKSMKDEEQQKAEEKYLALQALTGSIAHEMRNPLGMIRHNLDNILQESLSRGSDSADAPVFETINQQVAQAQMSLDRGLHVIDITLGNIRNDDISTKDFSCLSAAAATRKAINEYSYLSEEERQMVNFDSRDDFMFRGDENSYVLVLYNLLVNALYFLQPIPDGCINIRFEQEKDFNRIFIRDNGPGISSEDLDKIFNAFFTSGKAGGTGLGLAFCKRIMRSFGGDILCNSEKGGFTEFVLSFPVLDKSLIDAFEARLYDEYKPVFSGKKLLLAGTCTECLAMIRRLLAPFDIAIDDVADGAAAMNLIFSSRYDLLVIDSNLPLYDQTDSAHEIKENGKEIPVVAYTTSKHPLPGKRVTETSGIDTWISMPPALSELLYALKTALQTARETLKESLEGKTVLVVDDLDLNRNLIKSMLNKFGVKILEASDGKAALEMLENHHCDLLIMDMNMPVLDGLAASRQIRTGSSAYRNIPILGLSGNQDNDTLEMAKQSGLNDFLMKPVKLKEFQQKVAIMLKSNLPAAC